MTTVDVFPLSDLESTIISFLRVFLSIFSYAKTYVHYQFSETFLNYLSFQIYINSTLQKLNPGQHLSHNRIISMAKHAVHASLSCMTQKYHRNFLSTFIDYLSDFQGKIEKKNPQISKKPLDFLQWLYYPCLNGHQKVEVLISSEGVIAHLYS